MQRSLCCQIRNRPMPLTSSVMRQMMAFTAFKKTRSSLRRHSAFRTSAKIYLSEKSSLGLVHVKYLFICFKTKQKHSSPLLTMAKTTVETKEKTHATTKEISAITLRERPALSIMKISNFSILSSLLLPHRINTERVHYNDNLMTKQ